MYWCIKHLKMKLPLFIGVPNKTSQNEIGEDII